MPITSQEQTELDSILGTQGPPARPQPPQPPPEPVTAPGELPEATPIALASPEEPTPTGISPEEEGELDDILGKDEGIIRRIRRGATGFLERRPGLKALAVDAPVEFGRRFAGQGPFEALVRRPEEAIGELEEAAGEAIAPMAELIEKTRQTGQPPIRDILARTAVQTAVEAAPFTTPLRTAADILGGRLLIGGARAIAPAVRAGIRGLVRPTARVATTLARRLGFGARTAARRGKQVPGAIQKIRKLARSAERALEEPSPTARQLAGEEQVTPTVPIRARDVSEIITETEPIPIGKARAPRTRAAGTIPQLRGQRVLSRDINEARNVAQKAIEVPSEARKVKLNLTSTRILQRQADEIKKVTREERGIVGKAKDFLRTATRNILPVDDQLKQTGPVGQFFAEKIERASKVGEIRDGSARAVLQDVFSELTDEADKLNLVEVLDKRVSPNNSKVKIAAEVIRSMLNTVAKDAKAAGLTIKKGRQVVPWAPLKNFYPHVLDVEATQAALATDKSAKNAILRRIMKSSRVSSKEAERIFADTFEKSRTGRFAPLEKGRTVDHEFFIRDPEVALNKYFNGVFRRVEMARAFGPDGKKFDKLLKFVDDDVDRKFIEGAFGQFSGREVKPASQELLRKLVDVSLRPVSVSLMGLSSISNAFQGLFGSAIRTTLPDALKAVRQTYFAGAKTRAEARSFAKSAGAIYDDIARESAGEFLNKRFLDKTFFTALEERNRITSSVAAKHYSNRLLGWLKNGQNLDLIRREFRKFKLPSTPEKVIDRGHFTNFEMKLMANEITNVTQGRARIQDLPLFAQNEIGRALLQLKNFSINWGKFAWREMIKEGLPKSLGGNNNLKPMVRMLAVGAALGEVPADIRALISGRRRAQSVREALTFKRLDRPSPMTGVEWELADKTIGRALENIMWLGSLGMLTESLGAGLGGASSFKAFMSAPSIGFVGEVLQARKDVADRLSGARTEAGKFKAPPVGETIIKFAGKRVAPFAAAALPKPVALPFVVGARALGERPERVTGAIQAAQRRAGLQ